ncbi:MAG: cell division protein ZapA [Pseudohongiellaceae bacterium]|jgi:cell division protein ZapA
MPTTTGSVTINIMGRDYLISCPADEEESLRKSARYLDQQMEDVRKRGSSLGYEKIAVLAAINITHDLLKMGKTSLSSESNSAYEIKILEKKIDAALMASRQIKI